jgi:magnesium-transporting ATPase (P-type)
MQLFPLFIYLFYSAEEKANTLKKKKPSRFLSLVDLNVEKCFRFVSISVAVLFFLFFFFFRVKGWQQQQQHTGAFIDSIGFLCVCVSSFSL